MKSHTLNLRTAVLGGLLCCSGLLPACERPVAAPWYQAPQRRADATYKVRGLVVSLPKRGDARSNFYVRHEAIDDFRNKDGKIIGMSAMEMEFPPEAGVSFDGIAVGDPVEIAFSVWWGETPAWLATKVTKLPAGTALVFEKAKPVPQMKPADPSSETPKNK
ncbi:MAG: hypothetical protein KIT68_06550 [Phycisphaeraceae bacterium]|nr:hypothetical protein [Phycisphaeraceae bacterium]